MPTLTTRRSLLQAPLALLPAASAAAAVDASAPALNEVHRGMAFGFLAKNGYYDSPEGIAQIDRMAKVGVKWVSVIVTIMQETYASTRVYSDYERTPNDAEVERIIDRIRARGMKVMLYPCLEMHDSVWRGKVDFPIGQEQIQGVKIDLWTPWFQSYTACYRNYARLAQRKKAELICLGAEMAGAAKMTDHWLRLIEGVRKEFSGPITYELQGPVPANLPGWYKELDIVGYSFYRPVAKEAGASLDQMVEFLQPSVRELRDLAQRTGKNVIFTEGGCLARAGATVKPGLWKDEGRYDGQEQVRWLDAVMTAFWPQSWWRGLYWWKCDEQQHRPQYFTDPAGEQGFTPWGKPVEARLKHWFSRTDRA